MNFTYLQAGTIMSTHIHNCTNSTA